MVKNKHILLLTAMMALATNTLAQRPSSLKQEPLKATPKERLQMKQARNRAATKLRVPRLLSNYTSSFPTMPSGNSHRALTVRRADGTNVILWGNINTYPTWTDTNNSRGFYKLNTQPYSATALFTGNDVTATGGTAVIGDKLYYVKAELYGIAYGFADSYLVSYNTSTWEQAGYKYISYDPKYVALETAQDQTTHTVYGEFYTGGSNYELGTIDYTTSPVTRTTIKSTYTLYAALGISSDGYLYGIASDGNLYKIDKTDGTETLVGSTGITIADENGQFSQQSGEIDQTTNTFYWASLDKDGNAALYTVDLQDAHVEKITDLETNEQILGLTIPFMEADLSAPAKVSGLTATFPGSSLDGTVSFTLPSKTYGDSTLTGALDYSVTCEGGTLATGSADAGTQVDAAVTAPHEGYVTFKVKASNAAGDGPEDSCKVWAGPDMPSAISYIYVTVNTQDNTVALSWDAPTTGEHGGVLADLTYDVYRMSGGDTTKVASAITATAFTDTITGKLSSYNWGVVPRNGELAGQMTTSKTVMLGDALDPPFFEDFETEDDFNFFTVINANGDWGYSGDQATFHWIKPGSWQDGDNGSVACDVPYNKTSDDWLVTPLFNLKGGTTYTLTFKTRKMNTSGEGTMEVKYGTDKTVEGLTNTVMEATAITNTSYEEHSAEIKSTVDGKYYIGFHALGFSTYCYLDDIRLEAAAEGETPDSVTALTVTPDSHGGLEAEIAFTAPTLTTDSTELDKLQGVRVERDGEVVKDFTNVKPGDELSFVDTGLKNGNNAWTVTPYTTAGNGRKRTVNAFVGEDVPVVPHDFAIADEEDHVRLFWEKPSEVGANGLYVNPDSAHYIIYPIDPDWNSVDIEHPVDTVTTPYLDIPVNTTEGTYQHFVEYSMRPYSKGGMGNYSFSGYVAGPVTEAPYKDSFAGGTTNRFWWLDSFSNLEFDITLNADYSVDEDGGCVELYPYNDSGMDRSMNTEKVSLASCTEPMLSFYHMETAPATNSIIVEIQKPDGTKDSILYVDCATDETMKWKHEVVDLSDYKSERYIMARIHVYSSQAEQPMYIDNVEMRDIPEHDITVTATSKASVKRGQSVPVTVKVFNNGQSDESAYHLTIADGDSILVDDVIEKQLMAYTDTTLAYSLSTTSLSEEDVMHLTVTADIEDDGLEDNNATTLDVEIQNGEASPVSDLAIEGNTLTWKAPENAVAYTTEDFEEYDPWSTSFGKWTLVDGNEGLAFPYFSNNSYPGQGTKMAYIIFSPSDLSPMLTTQYPFMAAHSGEQYAAVPYEGRYSANEQPDSTYDGDNWLISPVLPGNAQTVSFWVHNWMEDYGTVQYQYPESYEFLYSTTDNAVRSFSIIGDTRTIEDKEWQKVSVDLPEGAKYFAIHQTTPAATALQFGVDDITFLQGVGAPVSYRIYFDGKLVGTSKNLQFAISEMPADGTMIAVTAVYADGQESVPAYFKYATGINTIDADATLDIYTIGGVHVNKDAHNTKGLQPGVYIINGKQQVVK